VRKSRGGIMGFMRYWTIISLGPIVLGTAFALSSTVTSMHLLKNTLGGYELNFTFLLSFSSFALTCLGISLLYWTIPNRSIPLRSACIAGVFSGTIFILIKQFFGFVMSNFTSYQLVYGAFAAIPIFLLWIYTSWNIILLGVEISYGITAFHSKSAIKRHPIIMMLDILQLFYQKQLIGQTVSDKEALDILGRSEIGRWAYYVELLEKQKLIAETDHNEYVLIRNLNHVNLWDFIISMPFALPHRQDLGNVHPDDTWMQVLGPRLADADDYLSSKLAIPLAKIFEG
jgi:membrane protein